MKVREETGVTDKTGKMICVGDVVQFKLMVKHSGPSVETVEKRGKRYVTVQNHQYGGPSVTPLDQARGNHMVIIDRP